MGVVRIQYCYCSSFFYPSQQGNAAVSNTHSQISMIKISCKPHLINTLIEERQAGVFIADK